MSLQRKWCVLAASLLCADGTLAQTRCPYKKYDPDACPRIGPRTPPVGISEDFASRLSAVQHSAYTNRAVSRDATDGGVWTNNSYELASFSVDVSSNLLS